MKRLFFALELAEDALDALTDLQEAFAPMLGRGMRVRWTPRANMHLTVKFLGSTEDDLIESVAEVMDDIAAEFAPFEMSVEGLGAFPHPRHPRILWAGIDRASAEILATMHRRLEKGLEAYEIERDEHPFKAHVTYGRVKSSRAPRFDKLESDLPSGPYGTTPIDRVTLFESDLGDDGATHTPLHRSSLG